MKMKKLLLTLGTVAAVAAPVAAVVACSSDESTTIYSQFTPIGHVEYKTDEAAPFFVPSLGNSALIVGTPNAGAKTEFLVPLSYLKITDAKAPTFNENGTIDDAAVPAKAELSDLGKKDTLFAAGFTFEAFNLDATKSGLKLALPKGTIVTLPAKNVANIGNNKAVVVTEYSTPADLETYITGIAKDFALATTADADTDADKIYVKLADAQKARDAYNKPLIASGADSSKLITGKDVPAIMNALRTIAIETYFGTIKTK